MLADGYGNNLIVQGHSEVVVVVKATMSKKT